MSKSKERQQTSHFLSKREREKKRQADLGRRRLLRAGALIGGVVLTGGAVGLYQHFSREDQQKYPEPTPLPEVNPQLVEEILQIEGSYTREDMADPLVRKKHLELMAEAFSLYSGEPLTKKQLVEATVWLSEAEFNRKYQEVWNKEPENIGAYVDRRDKKIYFNETAVAFTTAQNREIKSQIPSWSALSRARLNYTHEWYHLAGAYSEKTVEHDFVKGRYEQMVLYALEGFTLKFKDPVGPIFGEDTNFEEVFAYYMTSHFGYKLTGSWLAFTRIGTDLNSQMVNLSVERLMKIFALKPEWVGQFQKFHRESDLLGFARFLADQRDSGFPDAQSRDLYGLNLLFGMFRKEGEPIFADFVGNIR